MAKSESKYLTALKEKCKTKSLSELTNELKTTNMLLFVLHLLGISSALFTYIAFANYQYYAAGTLLFIAVIFISGIVTVGQDTKAVVKEFIAQKTDD